MEHQSNTLKEGTKFDDGKPNFDLLSTEWLEGTATVLTYGADKYEKWNWAGSFDEMLVEVKSLIAD